MNPIHKAGKKFTVKAIQHFRFYCILQKLADFMKIYIIAVYEARYGFFLTLYALGFLQKFIIPPYYKRQAPGSLLS